MKQDANKIIDKLNNEWANDMVVIKKRMAILSEENERLKAEISELNKKIKSDKEVESDDV